MDTILTVNATGHTINSWGKNMFFLPHMITVDKKNNIWLTDVALHQVFKFAPYGGDHTPLIALGERFVPGSDDKHYCKPTSVAVSDDTTSFYVSDGYCNSRVIKYGVTVTPSGTHEVKKLFEWGKGSGPFTVKQGPNSFNIPHGLALAEDRGEVCVADRENGRVQCFSLDGDFTRSIKPEEFGSRIFSVAYTQAKGEIIKMRYLDHDKVMLLQGDNCTRCLAQSLVLIHSPRNPPATLSTWSLENLLAPGMFLEGCKTPMILLSALMEILFMLWSSTLSKCGN